MNFFIVNSNSSLVNAIEQSLSHDRSKILESASLDTVIDEIKETKPQAVIINWTKGDFDAEDIIKKIKRIRSIGFIYILVITTKDFQKKLEPLISAGADDFIFKPFSKEDLSARILVAQKIIKTEKNFTKSKKELIKLAKEDPLTGLMNRRAVLDETLKEMERSFREKKYISTILVRIGNFTSIVDAKGGMVGDMLLIDIANRLRAISRPYDKLGRYGLNEYLMVLPDTGAENAEHVIIRFLDSLDNEILEITKMQKEVKITIGVSELSPYGTDRVNAGKEPLKNDIILDELLRRTEEAANSTGKSRYSIIPG